MTTLKAYLNSRKVQKVLSTRPGEEGFSLIELVVVIAVLAILAAVAIPAFNGIQNDARASAVKSGMANGIKECLVLQARGKEGFNDAGGLGFPRAAAFEGDYKGYQDFEKWDGGANVKGCFGVKATPSSGYDALPKLFMAVDSTGEVTKACIKPGWTKKSDWEGSNNDAKQFCW